MFKTFNQVKQYITDHEIRMIDLKFCDLWDRWHHLTLPASYDSQTLMREGVGIDGSMLGLKSIESSDMVLIPDLARLYFR